MKPYLASGLHRVKSSPASGPSRLLLTAEPPTILEPSSLCFWSFSHLLYVKEDDYVVFMFTSLTHMGVLRDHHIFKDYVFRRDPRYIPTGSQIARVRERARSEAEAEVRAKASCRMTKSDRGEP
ncbi:hypothetical protein E5676_scaffold142G00780 [Cucumis melo var. makuwa]|uniref:Uncharacterized protein n=1 Tax=Cucumis melo var. makuwa TaxID=1194695 RepID=A0A5D3DHJ2_CUCMM|nr:hypothetical protein E6C27_scaffold124G00370 [Cucumis melo var. makuwa]TYK23096.1 hypothetical protein E5676_scaffold142G00780 [Cucumis melo var. makuwa]